jgi:hypothetical protein
VSAAPSYGIGYAVTPYGYRIQVWENGAEDNFPFQQITAGNSRYDSEAFVALDDGAALPVEALRDLCANVVSDLAGKYGAKVQHDEDLEADLLVELQAGLGAN